VLDVRQHLVQPDLEPVLSLAGIATPPGWTGASIRCPFAGATPCSTSASTATNSAIFTYTGQDER